MKDIIAKLDKDNQFDVLRESYKQIAIAWGNSINLSSIDTHAVENIIVSGLGGSAISGDLLRNYLRRDLTYFYMVNRTYELPACATDKTLVIISSYSGNTEETIAVLKQALQKKCQVICLTTGGEIQKIAQQENLPVVALQKGFQPRYALYANFFNLLKVFQELGFIDNQAARVNAIIEHIKMCGEKYSNADERQNPAIILAQELLYTTPVIYSVSDYTDAIGLRFKGQLNENSKMHAFHNVLPEMNHNEIIGWENYSAEAGDLAVVNLMDDDYHKAVKNRFEIIEELLSGTVSVLNLEGMGSDYKVRIFDLVYLCDWLSYYLAILTDKDPSEIEYIHHLKNELAKRK